eukprot:1157927-Pelagomonas_calceolata.AAC.2
MPNCQALSKEPRMLGHMMERWCKGGAVEAHLSALLHWSCYEEGGVPTEIMPHLDLKVNRYPATPGLESQQISCHTWFGGSLPQMYVWQNRHGE